MYLLQRDVKEGWQYGVVEKLCLLDIAPVLHELVVVPAEGGECALWNWGAVFLRHFQLALRYLTEYAAMPSCLLCGYALFTVHFLRWIEDELPT